MMILDEKSEVDIKKLLHQIHFLSLIQIIEKCCRMQNRKISLELLNYMTLMKKKNRNQDYAEDQDQLFSMEHLLYKKKMVFMVLVTILLLVQITPNLVLRQRL